MSIENPFVDAKIIKGTVGAMEAIAKGDDASQALLEAAGLGGNNALAKGAGAITDLARNYGRSGGLKTPAERGLVLEDESVSSAYMGGVNGTAQFGPHTLRASKVDANLTLGSDATINGVTHGQGTSIYEGLGTDINANWGTPKLNGSIYRSVTKPDGTKIAAFIEPNGTRYEARLSSDLHDFPRLWQKVGEPNATFTAAGWKNTPISGPELQGTYVPPIRAGEEGRRQLVNLSRQWNQIPSMTDATRQTLSTVEPQHWKMPLK